MLLTTMAVTAGLTPGNISSMTGYRVRPCSMSVMKQVMRTTSDIAPPASSTTVRMFSKAWRASAAKSSPPPATSPPMAPTCPEMCKAFPTRTPWEKNDALKWLAGLIACFAMSFPFSWELTSPPALLL